MDIKNIDPKKRKAMKNIYPCLVCLPVCWSQLVVMRTDKLMWKMYTLP